MAESNGVSSCQEIGDVDHDSGVYQCIGTESPSMAVSNGSSGLGDSRLWIFRRELGALLATFQTLCPDDRTKAISITREALARMQAAVKYQLCNDALRTVAALAENMIQEAYGLIPNDTMPPPSIYPNGDKVVPGVNDADHPLNESSIDNSDVLTNALYATLQAVNPNELSPPTNVEDVTSVSYPSPIPINIDYPHSGTESSSFTDQSMDKDTRELKCAQCDYVAKHRQNLHRHQKLHIQRQLPLEQGRPFACDICDRRFTTKWAVKEHTKYKHSLDDASNSGEFSHQKEGPDSFGCEYCGKSFAFRNGLKRHMDTVHFKNRRYQCLHCDKDFSTNFHLKRHVETVHMALRCHECSHCGKRFSTAYHLKRHKKNTHLVC